MATKHDKDTDTRKEKDHHYPTDRSPKAEQIDEKARKHPPHDKPHNEFGIIHSPPSKTEEERYGENRDGNSGPYSNTEDRERRIAEAGIRLPDNSPHKINVDLRRDEPRGKDPSNDRDDDRDIDNVRAHDVVNNPDRYPIPFTVPNSTIVPSNLREPPLTSAGDVSPSHGREADKDKNIADALLAADEALAAADKALADAEEAKKRKDAEDKHNDDKDKSHSGSKQADGQKAKKH